MWIFHVGEAFAKVLIRLLPTRLSKRIKDNCSEYPVYVLATKTIKTKPRMTLIEAVFATLLFDLALFGTSNPFINGIITLFTSLQNSWDKTFSSKENAISQVQEFCNKLSIQQEPWIWEKPIENYISLNDFFSRKYRLFPPLGGATVVSPATCTVSVYRNNSELKSLLIKGCDYRIEDIGLPSRDIELYCQNPVLIGYLSPTDYHRVHSPISGKCTHCKLEGVHKKSASVKFFGGRFNLLNENKRLVVILESGHLKIALVIIGGIGVDSLAYNDITGKTITKGQEISAFRAGGSAVAVFATAPILFTSQFEAGLAKCSHVEVQVGESLANLQSQQ